MAGGAAMTRLLLTSGRGPAECRMALAGVARRLLDEARELGLAADIAYATAPDAYGAGSAIVALHGSEAAAFASTWAGTAQWISPSPIRPHHKRKNWFVGIVELGPIKAAPRPLDPTDVQFETFGAGGPGGQHQNKTETAVRARHIPTGFTVVVRNERSQQRNKSLALERLAELLALQAELQARTDRTAVNAAHGKLERGQALRTFEGAQFKPL